MTTIPDDQRDYITGSVAGILTLLIIAAGLVLLTVWAFGR